MPAGVTRDAERFAISPLAGLWAIIALTVGGGILRVVLAGQDLFADELATYWVVSTRGLTGVLDTVSSTAEITPPLSFVLSWFTTRLGLSEELVRLPALVAGIASIPLVYAVGLRTVGGGAAVLAATLTTLSPFMIFYSAEARGYGVLMGLLLLSTLALLLAVEDGQARWWVLYGACVCLAAYTHYTSAFVLAGQFGWALWVHPGSRRPLLLSTGAAALLYVPWLPGLKADLTSPTTDILGYLSPQSLETTRITLGHWTIGFPYAVRPLSDLPGTVPLVMLGLSLVIGLCGLVMSRSGSAARPAERAVGTSAPRALIVLVVVLAIATPVGTGLQSAVGTNVFSVRSLAASWPYLALAVAALLYAGRPALRIPASALAVGAFAVAALLMTGDDVKRPDYTTLAQFADEFPGAVVLNGPTVTPGPLTSLDVEGATPDGDVYRLFQVAQKERPFNISDTLPDPTEVFEQAIEAADGDPIVFIGNVPLNPVMLGLIDALPPGYEHTGTKVVEGLFDFQAQAFELDGEVAGG